jgi:pantothenate kinase type III
MQGLITLDLGNSNPHAGLFQKHQGQWALIKVVPLIELSSHLLQFNMSANNSSVVVCEVKAREEEITKLQEQGFLVTRIRDYWRGKKFAGMPVNYTQTLGEDRLIEAYYCFKKYHLPLLLIDAGTFVTMDIITANGFQGGYIIPGIKAYFEIYEKGEQLKNIALNLSPNQKLPHETGQAISGSYIAFTALAKKLITEHDIQKVILTGGSSPLWEGFLQVEHDSAVVEITPHLIHWALQYWMTTQIEPL